MLMNEQKESLEERLDKLFDLRDKIKYAILGEESEMRREYRYQLGVVNDHIQKTIGDLRSIHVQSNDSRTESQTARVSVS